jgi:deoxyribose-phosphate aldolase
MQTNYTYGQIAKMIDYALLNPTLTDVEMEEGCRLATKYDIAAVCVKPYFLRRCVELLEGTTVKPTTAIGFPNGSQTTAAKAAESREALRDGALELDMVVNIGKVLSGDWDFVREDISAVVRTAHENAALAKVIFENCYLTNEHKIALCRICAELSADFAKTSTGFGTAGATIDDIKLMRAHLPRDVRLKAAGGIRTLDSLLEFRALGVARIGTSATPVILDDCRHRLNS